MEGLDNIHLRAKEKFKFKMELGWKLPPASSPRDLLGYVEGLLVPSGILPPGLPIETYHEVFQSVAWRACGNVVFNLTASLAAALLLTDPPPVDEEEDGEQIHLPFDCFAIQIPSELVPFYYKGERYWTNTIWAHRFDSRHHSQGVRGFYRVTSECGTASVWRDRFIGDILAEEDERLYSAFPGDPLPEEDDAIVMSASSRIVRNLVAWLDATKFDYNKPADNTVARRKKSRKDKNNKLRPRVWMVGREVKLSGELRRAASEIATGNTSRAPKEWRRMSPFIVRGHWKRQVVGPRSEGKRKRIWIEPYWKRKEGIHL